MSRRDPKALLDGWSTILKGVNSGLAPVSLGRDEMAWAINATFRNNYGTCRPGLSKRTLNTTALTSPALFTSGIFQGAIAFERRGQLVTMIGGHLYSIDLDSWSVLDVSTPGDFNPNNRYRAWFAEAEDFIIAQDGQSPPWLYDGATSRRSDTFGIHGTREVPVGTAMCYGCGRLNVASPDGQQFAIGDIVGGDSGTAAYDYRDSVVKFTENQVIDGGGAFNVPINCGPITAFRPVAQLDTSTGQGPTQVLTIGAIFSLNTPTDRTTWATVTFPIETVSLVQSGGLSDRATVNVNGDIWTRSFDGIRSYIVARREFAYSWVNAPMSQEMVRAISSDDPYLLNYASAAVFDNRLLMTIQPYRSWGHGICHRGLAVLDFAPLAYLADRQGPAWEGIWTGLQVLQILTGNFRGHERCFVFALNASSEIELWELSRANPFDNDGTQDVPIAWSVESGGLTFPRLQGAESVPAQELVALDGGRLFVDDIEGTVAFAASYKIDQDPCWQPWHSWSLCATNAICGPLLDQTCTTPPTLQQQYRKPMFLPSPTLGADPVVDKNRAWGREAQVRLAITGKCRIKRFEALARDQQDDVVSLPAGNETCQVVTCDSCPNDYSYAIT